VTNFPNGLPPLPGGAPRALAPLYDEPAHDLQIQRLTVQLATAQAENRRLRRMTANGKQGRILSRAAVDARQVVGWREAGYCVSRRQCTQYGMSERRWMWAVALLKLAGVLAMDCTYADEFAVVDVAEIEQRIARAIRKVETNGLSLLEFRLPRGRVKMSGAKR
jgi:hypothetical protein